MDNIPRTPEEYRAWWREQQPDIPYGFCWCGCSNKTRLANKTSRRTRDISFKGEPTRYVYTHNRRSAPLPYTEEDWGYTTPCWVWQWGKTSWGYAAIYYKGRSTRGHCVYYEQKYGRVPDGLELHHLCAPFGGPRHCVNPDHLQPVTKTQNQRLGAATKLTANKVKQIRNLYRAGGLTYEDIAGQFGVCPATVGQIVRRRTWRDV